MPEVLDCCLEELSLPIFCGESLLFSNFIELLYGLYKKHSHIHIHTRTLAHLAEIAKIGKIAGEVGASPDLDRSFLVRSGERSRV